MQAAGLPALNSQARGRASLQAYITSVKLGAWSTETVGSNAVAKAASAAADQSGLGSRQTPYLLREMKIVYTHASEGSGVQACANGAFAASHMKLLVKCVPTWSAICDCKQVATVTSGCIA